MSGMKFLAAMWNDIVNAARVAIKWWTEVLLR